MGKLKKFFPLLIPPPPRLMFPETWKIKKKKKKKKQYIFCKKSKVTSSDKSGRSIISCLYSYSYMKMYIPIAKQSKYQFLTEGKANKQLSRHRAPPARYFRLHYLTITYSLICRTYGGIYLPNFSVLLWHLIRTSYLKLGRSISH